MIPFGPYPLEAVEPAAAAVTALLSGSEAHAACRALMQHLRDLPGVLPEQQVEYITSFLSMAGEEEASAAGACQGYRNDGPTVVNALSGQNL